MNEGSIEPASSKPNRTPELAACAFFSLFLLAYAGLIALGRWDYDEYKMFYQMRGGWTFLRPRLSWSPRPISEVIYCGYGWLVNHFHRPFIIAFLAFLWTIWIAAGLFTSWQSRRELHRDGALIPALTLMTLSLAGGAATGVLYWPAGAVAYLPTLAATLLLFLQIVDGKLGTRRGRLLAAICLTVAAASSEAGATFVLCYGSIQLLRLIAQGLRRSSWRVGRPMLWHVVPLSIALAVLVSSRLHRFESLDIPPTTAAAVASHPVASLIAGLKDVVAEFAGHGTLGSAIRLRPLQTLAASRFTMEILLFTGIGLYWSRLPRPTPQLTRRILEVVAALLLGCLLTAAAANLQFGYTCCERHQLLRQSWMAMSLAGLAIASGAWAAERQREWLAKHARKAPLLLCLAVLSLWPLGPLVRTYRLYGALVRANRQNFDSGFRGDSTQMSVWILPATGIVGKVSLPSGVFTRPANDVYPFYLLGFFDKERVVICPLDLAASAAGRLPDSTCPNP